MLVVPLGGWNAAVNFLSKCYNILQYIVLENIVIQNIVEHGGTPLKESKNDFKKTAFCRPNFVMSSLGASPTKPPNTAVRNLCNQ